MANRSKKGRPAFSVQQPFAEQILQGVKTFEYRTIRTHTRGRVYVYASRTIYRDADEWRKLGLHPGQVPTGQVVGTVEIIDCDWSAERKCYRWHLTRPQRLPARRPLTHPQPVWFYPFARDSRKKVAISGQSRLPFDPPTFRKSVEE